MSDTDDVVFGVRRESCEKTNTPSAVHGVVQLVSCETNDVETPDPAIELVRNRANSYMNEEPDV